MATKKLLESPAKMQARHEVTLTNAWKDWFDAQEPRPAGVSWVFAEHDYRKLRAAVKAAYPGRQRNAKLVKELDAAVKAVARVIRRRG